LKGRVLKDKGITPAREGDSWWGNVVNMYRRFESNEIPAARVLARFQGDEKEVVADQEGFFEVLLEPRQPAIEGPVWLSVDLQLLEPRSAACSEVRAEGQVLAITPTAQYGVISDIDDTIWRTNVNNPIRMSITMLFGNAQTRQLFEGVSSFYRALQLGTVGVPSNPLFYVSSTPWNIYDVLSQFFEIHRIPYGPMLFLRDWGITENEFSPLGTREHKLNAIHQILDRIIGLPFILIGDIRDVSHSLKRTKVIQAMAEEVQASGSQLILAETTQAMADHAARQGWIARVNQPLSAFN
jgi:phosphatidate phosphatase APP1